MRKIAALFGFALLSGCGLPQSMLSPGGPASQSIAALGWFVFILFLVVTAIMWGLILWIGLRRRGSFEYHAPFDIDGGQRWIVIGGFIIPAIILAVVFIYGLSSMSAFPLHDHHGAMGPPDIRITGHQWWWQVEYVKGPVDRRVLTANEIHIPAGRPVDIDLASDDVIHSFWVPALHGKVDLIPGMTNRIRIQANPGSYRGQCAEYCGAQHGNMILLVVADAPDRFESWLNAQRQPAVEPVDGQQRRGQDLFMSRPCALCHTIRGTLAQARVGPDLTHIGSRRRIAANMLENNAANLAAWITHAQSLKPAVAMPNITQFTGEELRAVVAYLQSLK
jgi:cytochrome c oxidase subunit 2